MLDWTLEKKTSFYKIGHISANTGPIFKIQNLAYSGERPRPAQSDKYTAHDDAREIASHARRRDVMQSLTSFLDQGALVTPGASRDYVRAWLHPHVTLIFSQSGEWRHTQKWV